VSISGFQSPRRRGSPARCGFAPACCNRLSTVTSASAKPLGAALFGAARSDRRPAHVPSAEHFLLRRPPRFHPSRPVQGKPAGVRLPGFFPRGYKWQRFVLDFDNLALRLQPSAMWLHSRDWLPGKSDNGNFEGSSLDLSVTSATPLRCLRTYTAFTPDTLSLLVSME